MRKIIELARQEKKNLNKDFDFYNSNTELFAIWTAFYVFFASIFFFSLGQSLLTIFIVNSMAFVIGLSIMAGTIFYLHATGQKGSLANKAHRLLNRTLFSVSAPKIKIEAPKIQIKKFRLLYK